MPLTSLSGGGETAFSECATKGSWLLTLSRRCVRRSCDSGLSERVRVFDGPLDLKKHDSGNDCRGCFRCRRDQLDTDVANDSHCAKLPGPQRCANTHMKLSSHRTCVRTWLFKKGAMLPIKTLLEAVMGGNILIELLLNGE
ncbi:hypothetical protein ERJ75_001808400 [Trypanosoma vivax]|nr:hypothetical protein ERJ75_001808400 [Trypanosoma vivax]